MTPWEEFTQSVVGRHLRLARRDNDWVFEFGEDLGITAAALWRIRASNGLRLTSNDDGHQYGLPSPVDAEDWAKELLDGAVVQSVESDSSTADLTIRLSNDLSIELLTDSSGYESWQAWIKSELAAVGRNGG